MSQSTIFQLCRDRSSLHQYEVADTVSIDSTGGETRTRNPSIPCLALYQLSHCASQKTSYFKDITKFNVMIDFEKELCLGKFSVPNNVGDAAICIYM